MLAMLAPSAFSIQLSVAGAGSLWQVQILELRRYTAVVLRPRGAVTGVPRPRRPQERRDERGRLGQRLRHDEIHANACVAGPVKLLDVALHDVHPNSCQ